MHIYIVEQDEEDRERVLQIVSTRRAERQTYESGTSFLAVCATLTAGVVIIDICLSDLDGLDLQRQIKRDCNVSHKVIMLAGECDISDAVASKREGAIEFLEKPIRRAELLDAMVRAELALCEEQHSAGVASEHNRVLKGLADRGR